jgi:hypothetical protein
MVGLAGTKGLGWGRPPASRMATLFFPMLCTINGSANPFGGGGSSPTCSPVSRDSTITLALSGSPIKTMSCPAATPAIGVFTCAKSKLTPCFLTLPHGLASGCCDNAGVGGTTITSRAHAARNRFVLIGMPSSRLNSHTISEGIGRSSLLRSAVPVKRMCCGFVRPEFRH